MRSILAALAPLALTWPLTSLAVAADSTPLSPSEAAAKIDRLVDAELDVLDVTPAKRVDEDVLLRRLGLDLAGQVPSSTQAALFALDRSPSRLDRAIDELLASESYGDRWARYWAAAIFTRSTNPRPVVGYKRNLETWLADELNAGTGWDAIVTELLSAIGDAETTPQTALLMAHAGQPEEVAGEVSRLFMGVQISCAQCHDHPFDRWTMREFHEFAAFFPRVQLRPRRDNGPILFTVQSFTGRSQRPDPAQFFAFADRNRDGYVSQDEANGQIRQAFRYLVRVGDRDDDGRLTLDEIKNAPLPPMQTGQGAAEHRMPNLSDPTDLGEVMDPTLFGTGDGIAAGTTDLERRLAAAAFVTSPENVWFARAVVNRYWNELVGEGFYVPVDDLGPDREPALPGVVDVLADGFVASGYDLRWLLGTIARTESYARGVSPDNADLAIAAAAGAAPTRLRGDQLFDRLGNVLGIEERDARSRRTTTEREFVADLFGADPSTSKTDLTAGIPQALFLMNAEGLEKLIDTRGRNEIAAVVREAENMTEAVERLYDHILGRLPTDAERRLLRQHLKAEANSETAIEDIAWALLNSAEFLSRD